MNNSCLTTMLGNCSLTADVSEPVTKSSVALGRSCKTLEDMKQTGTVDFYWSHLCRKVGLYISQD
jgi:hypothetical protein